jgi:predicted dehydrogenase
MGEEPSGIAANAHSDKNDPRFKEVEETLSWTMKFPSGAVADCVTTYGANMPGYFRVYGSKGMMHCDSAFGYQGQHLTAQFQGGAPIDMPSTAKDPSQFPPQADHMAECIMQDKEPKSAGEEGLRDMKLMHEIYRAAGLA